MAAVFIQMTTVHSIYSKTDDDDDDKKLCQTSSEPSNPLIRSALADVN